MNFLILKKFGFKVLTTADLQVYTATQYMEEGQNIQNQEVQQESPFTPNTTPNVSFPTVGTPKKSGGPKTLLIIGILVLVGILGFVIYKSASKKDTTVSDQPTPFYNLTAPDNTTQGPTTAATATPAPVATAKPADKGAISITIQNGTGISGEAAYLQTQLKNLGYTNVKTGNASSTGATSTTVTFSSAVSAAIVSEITQELNSLYQTVATQNSSTLSSGVLIVTGLKKGATPKPSTAASATPKASASPSASPVAN